MKWFGRKTRRPRGPNLPQARALNWNNFVEESGPKLDILSVPSAAWATQEAFEDFLRTGRVFGDDEWVARKEQDRDELRRVIWRYREQTKQRFGASFLEVGSEPSRYSLEQVLRELQKSHRWGTNEQPVDVRALAETMASLPLFLVEMKREDTLLLKFLRPLSDEQTTRLLQAIGGESGEDGPFVRGDPKLDAYCWWD